MSSPANDELATVLLKRYECLNALINHPQAKPELVDTLDMPRSTLDDVVRVSSNKQISSSTEMETGIQHSQAG